MDYSNADYLALNDVIGQNVISMNLDMILEDDYLEHYQTKGAKHGVRRYQNYDGSLTPLGREHYGVGPAREKKSSVLGKIVKKKELSDEEKTVKAERKKERIKKRLRDKPKNIYRYRKELTNEDLDKLIQDIEFDRKCEDLKMATVNRRMAKIDRFTKGLGTIAAVTGASIIVYNNTSRIYNLLHRLQTGEADKLPLISVAGLKVPNLPNSSGK